MADNEELEELTSLDAPVQETPPADKPITSADLAAAISQATGALQSKLDNVTGELTAYKNQSRPQNQVAETDNTDYTSQFLTDPKAFIKKAVAEGLADTLTKTVLPAAQRFADQSATSSIKSFKRDKAVDPLWNGVEPEFDKQVGTLNKEWLGQLTGQQLDEVLTTAYDASYGRYVQEQAKKKRAAKAAANLGGTTQSTSAAEGKTLQELDPIAYNLAMQSGLSEDDMKEIVKAGIEAGEYE